MKHFCLCSIFYGYHLFINDSNENLEFIKLCINFRWIDVVCVCVCVCLSICLSEEALGESCLVLRAYSLDSTLDAEAAGQACLDHQMS